MNFEMDKEEREKMRAWVDKHERSRKCPFNKKENQGCSGGRYTYHITYTTIGVVLSITCVCGARCDLTDYGDW